MAVKPNGSACTILEQIIEDPGTGLTLQFMHIPGSDAPYRLRIAGDGLPYGNREILFNEKGAEAGAGVALTNACRPSWIKEVG